MKKKSSAASHSPNGGARRDTTKGDARASVNKGHDRLAAGRAVRCRRWGFIHRHGYSIFFGFINRNFDRMVFTAPILVAVFWILS